MFPLDIQTKTLGSREYAAEFNGIIEKINQINLEIGDPSLDITNDDIPHKNSGDPVDYLVTNFITERINAIIALNPSSGISDLALTPETSNSTWEHGEFNNTVAKINELVGYVNGEEPPPNYYYELESGSGYYLQENNFKLILE